MAAKGARSANSPPAPSLPAALYSPVRAVPLRPRLHSPNGHRAASPRQTSALQPIVAASGSKPLAGLKSCAMPQTVLGSSPAQRSSASVNGPVSVSSHFERSPSAARQLQIIALSSGRQPHSGTYAHTMQPAPPTLESPELSVSEVGLPLPPNPTLPKTTSPMSSPPSLLSPASPPTPAGPQTQTVSPRCEGKESEEGWRARPGARDEGIVGKDVKVEKEDQRDRVMDKQRLPPEKEGGRVSPPEQKAEAVREEEHMEVTEEGARDGTEQVEEKKMEAEEEGEAVVDQSEKLYQSPDPVLSPEDVKDSSTEPKPILGLISAPVQTPSSASLAAATPVPEVPVQSQRLPESHRDLHPGSQEDFCENMSTQSDNQSGTFAHKAPMFTVDLSLLRPVSW